MARGMVRVMPWLVLPAMPAAASTKAHVIVRSKSATMTTRSTLRRGWADTRSQSRHTRAGVGLRVGSGVGLGAGLDQRGGRLGLREVAAGQDDCRTEPGELGGGAQPDATVGAGHNAHLAAEVGAG